MIKISRDTNTKVAFNLQSYRDLSALKAELIFSDTVSVAIPSISEALDLTVAAATVATLPTGKLTAKFSVMKQDGTFQVAYLIETEIVDGAAAGNEVVYLAIPNTISIPSKSGTVDDLVNGRVKVNKFLFTDSDNNEYMVTAIMDGGYPTLKVEKQS